MVSVCPPLPVMMPLPVAVKLPLVSVSVTVKVSLLVWLPSDSATVTVSAWLTPTVCGDVAVIPLPELKEKIAIAQYLIRTARALGIELTIYDPDLDPEGTLGRALTAALEMRPISWLYVFCALRILQGPRIIRPLGRDLRVQ